MAYSHWRFTRILLNSSRIRLKSNMKTKLTVTVDEELVPAAKQFARTQGVSLSQLIEDALREMSMRGSPAFSERWRGKFRPADREDERYRQLKEKYL